MVMMMRIFEICKNGFGMSRFGVISIRRGTSITAQYKIILEIIMLIDDFFSYLLNTIYTRT